MSVDEQGHPIDVRDPLAAKLKAAADIAGFDVSRLASALVGFREVFGDDLPRDPRFMAPVVEALAKLVAWGSRRTVEHYAKP